MQPHLLNKGNVSNVISLLLLLSGIWGQRHGLPASGWVLAAGLFGFAGGTTNWLAVKMLFDRVPLLYGSGVIPARFREIRSTIRDLIMRHFFAPDYLRRFFATQTASAPDASALEGQIAAVLASPAAEAAIDTKLAALMDSPSGMLLKMAGAERIKPLVQEFVAGVGQELAPHLASAVQEAALDPGSVREQVDALLAAKLEELTPETVKRMMEEVMREHLGWLIVWGNVFGGAIGLASRALGY